MKPGLGYQSSRQRTLERHTAASDRVPPNQGREANPRFHRNGRHRGITVDEIEQGTAGTVKLVYHNGIGFKVAKDSNNDDITVEAYCYLLNTADTIAADTAVILMRMDDGTWDIVDANCDARDWELFEEGEASVATSQQSIGDELAVNNESYAANGEFSNQDFGSIGGPQLWQG